MAHRIRSDEGISPAAMNRICDEIIARKIEVNCSTNIRIEKQFDAALCNKMARAGFKFLYLGLESGCDRVLDHMQKGTSKEVAVAVCRHIVEAGMWNPTSTYSLVFRPKLAQKPKKRSVFVIQ